MTQKRLDEIKEEINKVHTCWYDYKETEVRICLQIIADLQEYIAELTNGVHDLRSNSLDGSL